MANKIKGITIEIGGDTTGLDRALKGVDSETRALQSELTQVNKQLKFDPTNTELLAQKQKILAKSIDDTKTRLSTLKEAEKQAQEQFKDGKISEEQYRALKREIIATETKLKGLETQAKNSNATLLKIDAVGTKFQNVGSKIEGVGKKLSIVSAGAGALLGGLVKAGIEAGKSADDINTLSKQTGLSTEQIQVFNYATDIVDVSIETLTGSMAKLIKNMSSAKNGSKNVQNAFKELGVAYTDNAGQLRNNQDVFDDTISALRKIENPTQRDALAMQIFGKSAQDLNPLILDTNNTLESMGKEAKKSGLILSQDALDGANEFNDALDTLKATAKASIAKLGTSITKVLMPAIEQLTKSASNILKFLANLDEGTLKTITRVLAITAVIGPLIVVIGKLTTGIGGTIKAVKSLFTLIVAHPITAIIVGVVALGTALYVLNEKLYKANDRTYQFIKATEESRKKLKDLNKEIENQNEEYQKNIDNININADANKSLADRLYDLAEKENKTNAEKENMKNLVNVLNEQNKDLNLTYDAQKDKLSKTREEVYKNIEAQKELAMAKAREERIVELSKQQIKLEKEIGNEQKNRLGLYQERNKLKQEYEELDNELRKKLKDKTVSAGGYKHYEYLDNLDKIENKIQAIDKQISDSDSTLLTSKNNYNDTITEINNLATFSAKNQQENQNSVKDNFVKNSSDMVQVYDENGNRIDTTSNKISDNAKNNFNNMGSNFKSNSENMVVASETACQGISNQFKKIDWSKIGTEASNGIWYGFASGMAVVDKKLAEKLKQTEKVAKKTWDIRSPSHLFEKEVGKMGAMGIGVGFENEMDNTNAKIQKSLQQDFSMNSKLNLNPQSKTETLQQQNNLSLSNALSQLQNLGTNNAGQEINVNVVLQADTDSFIRFITPKINVENQKIGMKGANAL